MKTLGTHLLCEMTGCSEAALGSVVEIETELRAAAEAAQVAVLHGYFHAFSPTGVTGFLCLAESHISIHTWPEIGYAAVDIYTCGEGRVPEKALEHLSRALGAEYCHVAEMTRGVLGDRARFLSVPVARVQCASVERPMTSVTPAAAGDQPAPAVLRKRFKPTPVDQSSDYDS